MYSVPVEVPAAQNIFVSGQPTNPIENFARCLPEGTAGAGITSLIGNNGCFALKGVCDAAFPCIPTKSMPGELFATGHADGKAR